MLIKVDFPELQTLSLSENNLGCEGIKNIWLKATGSISNSLL